MTQDKWQYEKLIGWWESKLTEFLWRMFWQYISKSRIYIAFDLKSSFSKKLS